MYLDDSLTEQELIDTRTEVRNARREADNIARAYDWARSVITSARPVPARHNAVRPIAYSYQ